jgi:hypothetical protein
MVPNEALVLVIATVIPAYRVIVDATVTVVLAVVIAVVAKVTVFPELYVKVAPEAMAPFAGEVVKVTDVLAIKEATLELAGTPVPVTAIPTATSAVLVLGTTLPTLAPVVARWNVWLNFQLAGNAVVPAMVLKFSVVFTGAERRTCAPAFCKPQVKNKIANTLESNPNGLLLPAMRFLLRKVFRYNGIIW